MTDRLPQPMADTGRAALGERASATSARRMTAPKATAPHEDRNRATPKSLLEVQRWLVGGILSEEAPAAIEQVLRCGPRLSASDRFEIYRSGYRARLVECLEDDYPVLSATLGPERFENLCVAYIDGHPSSSPNLNFFGGHLATFCRVAPDLGGPETAAFLSELCALEWAVVLAIHAAAPPPFDAARLQALPEEAWGEIRFARSEAARLLRFEFPVNAYYQAHRAGKDPAIPERASSATAVYRSGLTVWRMDLTPAMARVLEDLLASVPLGEALSRIGVDETDEAARNEAERSVMIWFREWVGGGLFRDFSLRR
jgi:hypothetical protein